MPGSSCALVSRALLDKVRAAARGKDSVTELLRLAHAMAQHSRCIPQALLHFRRELCANKPDFITTHPEEHPSDTYHRKQQSADRSHLLKKGISSVLTFRN